MGGSLGLVVWCWRGQSTQSLRVGWGGGACVMWGGGHGKVGFRTHFSHSVVTWGSHSHPTFLSYQRDSSARPTNIFLEPESPATWWDGDSQTFSGVISGRRWEVTCTLCTQKRESHPSFCLPSDAKVVPTMHLSQCLAQNEAGRGLTTLSFFLAFCRSLRMLGPSFGILWFSTLAVECLFLLSVFQKLKPGKWASLGGKQNKTKPSDYHAV